MRYCASFIGAGAFLLLATPVFAFGLTDSDYDYLASQNFEKGSAVLSGLSPKEQARLHAIIIDQTTSGNSAARAKDVSETMATFQDHQHWEETHPGQLWDSPAR
jgi:hypothetical protein